MHTYSTPTTPPPRSSEIWWSGRWDRQHDGVVSMVESMRWQGFACLRGGRRTEKRGFRNRAAAPQRTSKKKTIPGGASTWAFYSRSNLQSGLGQNQPASSTRNPRQRRQEASDRINLVSHERMLVWCVPGLLRPTDRRVRQRACPASPLAARPSEWARAFLAAAPSSFFSFLFFLYLFLINKYQLIFINSCN
jgi:hypothetical protein